MPTYDYVCRHCGQRVRLVLSYADYDRTTPTCPHCGRADLRRRLGRVAVARSEESRLDNLMADDAMAGMEDDPRAMGRFMRQMSQEMGENLGEELGEVAERLEKGESPEAIEKSMPDLGAESGTFDTF